MGILYMHTYQYRNVTKYHKNYLHLLVSNICEVGTICRLGGVLWVNVEVL